MLNVGLICDMKFERHPQFKSYYYAIRSLLGEPRFIRDKKELPGLDLLIVGDDHYDRHKEILQQPGFIGVCNGLDITVLVLTTEKIIGSVFPWNVQNYEKIKEINSLIHYTADVDDCEKLGVGLHRICISKYYKDKYRTSRKKDEVIFIGSVNCDRGSYDERKKMLDQLEKTIGLNIITSGKLTWEDYIKTIAEYRFVLCPMGNANFFPTRFYEVLAVGSIPLQQIKSNTLCYYDIEKKFNDCIYFESPDELPKKIKDCPIENSYNEFWTEDNLSVILRREHIL